ncbi:uncharacterized protein CLUP02_10584 [Colletotrichum lupini]|uniref:Uncharacterized protein n=1 Tax=Colletotrichum lupini TaxID=145971 RepID=A0A9Q8WIP5_9PEZI|nr:uncharacterized protein CLUP02_10584 [Colletotrichum lupini]UQC85088.1 hypothetical protein CLUP02_10584 [Colletotrichum lupini]
MKEARCLYNNTKHYSFTLDSVSTMACFDERCESKLDTIRRHQVGLASFTRKISRQMKYNIG